MPIGRPVSASTCLISSKSCRFWSWLPWLKLSRNTSTPASNSVCSRSGLELAGPRVATILALRSRRIGLFRPYCQRCAVRAEDEDSAEIIDIGQGRAGHDKITERREKAVRIVARQRFLDGEATPGGPG